MISYEVRCIEEGNFKILFLLSEEHLTYQCIQIDERVRGLDLKPFQPEPGVVKVLSVNSPLFSLGGHPELGMWRMTLYLQGQFGVLDKYVFTNHVGPQFGVSHLDQMVEGLQKVLRGILGSLVEEKKDD